MQVACSRCRTRYKIPNEKLEAGPIKVRCKECDHIFGVRKKKSPQDTPAPQPPPVAVDVPSPDEGAGEEGGQEQEEPTASEPPVESDLPCGPTEEPPGPSEEAAPEGDAAPEEEPEAASDDFGFGDLDLGGDEPSEEPASEEDTFKEVATSDEEDVGEEAVADEEAGEEVSQEEDVSEELAADAAGDNDTFGFDALDMDSSEVADEGEEQSQIAEADAAPEEAAAEEAVAELGDEEQQSDAFSADEAVGEEEVADESGGEGGEDDDFGFGALDLSDADFGEDDLGSVDLPFQDGEVAEEPQDRGENLGLDDFGADEAEEPAAEEPAAEEPAADAAGGSVEFDLSDFDSSVFDDDADAKLSVSSKGIEQSIEDIFDTEPEPEPVAAPSGGDEASGDFTAGLRELDLGAFDSDDTEFGAGDGGPSPDALERVEIDDLVTQPPIPPKPGPAEPRLDLRKGERRSEALATPVYEPAKRKKLPVIWALLISIAMGTAAFFGYNFLVQPDAAFYFLNPGAFMEWLERGQTDKVLMLTDPVEGAYLDRANKERLYVVSGWITNTSPTTKSAIEVKGEIYGPDGSKVAESNSFCGNVISREELEVLGDKEITERLTRSVGAGLTNLDVKRGDKVPFMVVFVAPPVGVEKFTIEVVGSTEAAKPPKRPKAKAAPKPPEEAEKK
jgi:predicted Zn finger-like uncharacterized protein